MTQNDKIELRSEKVRSIIGQIPSWIVRFGTGILSIIVLLFFLVGYFVKYPVTYDLLVSINSTPNSIPIIAEENGNISFYKINNNGKINKGDSVAKITNFNKENHVIISPINGRILQNYKSGIYIQKGATLCLINPDTIESYYIQTLIPYEYFSQICIGQKVNIEVDGYPSSDFGLLKGSIDYISPISVNQNNQTYFNIHIILPNKLVTTSKKSIEYSSELKGYARIMLSEKTLFKRLVGANGN
jgi:hypothetical protein